MLDVVKMRANWREHAAQYANDLSLWCEEQWVVRTTGSLIQLMPHQRYLDGLFFRRDEHGRFPWQTVLLAQPKKSGKTEDAGRIGLWYGLTEPGEPEVYYIANDREQARMRAFAAAHAVCRRNPVLSATCKLFKDRVILPGGGILETVSQDYAGGAGANPALTVFDELWGYVSEASTRLWDEFTPVPTRRNSLRLIVTYAGFREESELLWSLYTKCVKGGRKLPNELGLELYESKDGTTACFWSHTPRMPWQTSDYYKQQKATLRPSAYLRLHENRWVSAESAFVSAEMYDALPVVEWPQPNKTWPCYGGLDVAHKRDMIACVIVAWHPEGYPMLVRHAIWRAGPSVAPEELVIPWLRDVQREWDLRTVLYDPAHWESGSIFAQREGVPMEEWTQTPAHLTLMGNRLYEAINFRRLRVYPAPDLREHVLNAVVSETPRGWKLIKKAETRHIDGAVALAQALLAATERGPVDVSSGPLLTILVGGHVRE